MNKFAWLLVLISLLVPTSLEAKQNSVIKTAMKSSLMVVVDQEGSGSGFAVYEQSNDKTLAVTNDHVCQLSRGRVFLTHEVDYSSKLNTKEIYVVDASGIKHKAKAVKAANLHLLKKGQKGSDLCLISVEGKLPVVKLSADDMEQGDKIFSVGAPYGIFPIVHEGFGGPTYEDNDGNEKVVHITSLLIWPGSSGSAVFDYYTGEVVGVAFAILPASKKIEVPVVSLVVPVSQVSEFLNSYLKAS